MCSGRGSSMATRGVYVPDEMCEHCWCRVHSCVSGSPTHKRSGIADIGRDAASSAVTRRRPTKRV